MRNELLICDVILPFNTMQPVSGKTKTLINKSEPWTTLFFDSVSGWVNAIWRSLEHGQKFFAAKFLITPNILYLVRLFTNGYTQHNLLQTKKAKQTVRYTFTPINLSLAADILSLNFADKLSVFLRLFARKCYSRHSHELSHYWLISFSRFYVPLFKAVKVFFNFPHICTMHSKCKRNTLL